MEGANLRFLSALLHRAQLAAAGGLTFDGKRDLDEKLGYKKDLTPSDYRYRYRRGGIARRLVQAMPKATWRGGGEVIETEDPNVETEFEKTWWELEERLHIWSTFAKADILAGLGRYSIILIGAPGELNVPLTSASKDAVAYLQPFAEEDAVVHTYITDPKDARYGQPESYQIKRLAVAKAVSNGNASTVSKVVHWSRTIHIADELLDDMVFSDPRLECVWNLLDDLQKVTGGGAEAFWMRANQGMQINVDGDKKLRPEDEKKLADEVEEYQHGLRRIMRTQGVDINTLGSDVANFAPQAAAIIDQISATTGIPQRILMGSERGELASTQDRDNWADRVSDRRIDWAEPFVVRPLVDRFIELGVLPAPSQKTGYTVRWPQIKNMTDKERMEMAKNAASINREYGDTVVHRSEIRDKILMYPPIEDVEGFDEEEVEVDEEEIDEEDEETDEENEEDQDEIRAAIAATRKVVKALSKR